MVPDRRKIDVIIPWMRGLEAKVPHEVFLTALMQEVDLAAY